MNWNFYLTVYVFGYMLTTIATIAAVWLKEKYNYSASAVSIESKIAGCFFMSLVWPGLWIYWVGVTISMLWQFTKQRKRK